MAISAVDPIGPALQRTGRMLFKPMDLTKWLTLGFCAFLATLLEGGSTNFNLPSGPGPAPGTFAEWIDHVWQTFLRHAFWILPVAAILLAIGVVLIWLRARGKFMFLDGVVTDRPAVVEPWKRLALHANSYFRFELLLTVLVMVGGAAVAAGGYVAALPDIRANRMGTAAILVIVIGATLFMVLVIGYSIFRAIAEDFLIPIMYLRNQPIGSAWAEFRDAVVPGNFWSFVLFYLLRIAFGIASAMIMFCGMLLTCCMGALPFVSAVVFLPIFVFNRTYSLYFLQQVGNDYQLMVQTPAEVHGFPVVMSPMPPPPIPAQPPPPGGN